MSDESRSAFKILSEEEEEEEANAFYSIGDHARAIPLYEAYLQQHRGSVGNFNVTNISPMMRLSSCYSNNKEKKYLDKAIALKEECLVTMRLVYGLGLGKKKPRI